MAKHPGYPRTSNDTAVTTLESLDGYIGQGLDMVIIHERQNSNGFIAHSVILSNDVLLTDYLLPES